MTFSKFDISGWFHSTPSFAENVYFNLNNEKLLLVLLLEFLEWIYDYCVNVYRNLIQLALFEWQIKRKCFFFGNREKGSEMLLHAHNFILWFRNNCDQYKAIIERTHTESISCAIHISQRNFMEGTYAHCSNTSSSLAPSSIRWSVQVVNNTIKWYIVNSIKSDEIGLCNGIFVVRRKSCVIIVVTAIATATAISVTAIIGSCFYQLIL